MSDKLIKGMVHAFKVEASLDGPYQSDIAFIDAERCMRAAVVWLSENVTDEMVHSLVGSMFQHTPPGFKFQFTFKQTKEAVAAALLKASEAGE